MSCWEHAAAVANIVAAFGLVLLAVLSLIGALP
jgi:hypothetical protein